MWRPASTSGDTLRQPGLVYGVYQVKYEEDGRFVSRTRGRGGGTSSGDQGNRGLRECWEEGKRG
jgi:hypothetical protein